MIAQEKVEGAVQGFITALGLNPKEVVSVEVRAALRSPVVTIRSLKRDFDGNVVLDHMQNPKTQVEVMGIGWLDSNT